MAIIFERERDLEDMLIEHAEFFAEEFGHEGYTVHRQPNLGAYGIADIVAIQSGRWPSNIPFCYVKIFELKNEPLTHAHISQLARYREFFQQFDEQFAEFEVEGYLIGPKTFPTKDDLCFLAQSIPWLNVYEFAFNPAKGLEFKLIHGWKFSQDNSAAKERIWDLLDPGPAEIEQALIPKAANESTH